MTRNSDDIASFKQSIDYLSGKIHELLTMKQNVSQILSLINKLQSIITEKRKEKKIVIFKCYSSEKLIALNTHHEDVSTWYSSYS